MPEIKVVLTHMFFFTNSQISRICDTFCDRSEKIRQMDRSFCKSKNESDFSVCYGDAHGESLAEKSPKHQKVRENSIFSRLYVCHGDGKGENLKNLKFPALFGALGFFSAKFSP